MTELVNRVTRLETEMAEIRGIAEKAARDVEHVPAVLRGHTRVLNTLRKTQREHGERLDRLEHKVDEGFAAMREGFRQANQNFDVISNGFNQVGAGMARMEQLLTAHLDHSEES